MKKIALLIVVIFISTVSFCQINYQPGYIILLRGDTLHGYIDYRNWERNPDKISFKEKLNNDVTIYGSMDIRGFGVLDEIYESAIIPVEISPDMTNDLNFDPELKFSVDTAFLQTMIKGKKSLYFYMNKFGKQQFYIKNDSVYELLVEKKYLKRSDGTAGMIENKKFLGQLSVYLQDCPKIQSKLKNTIYSKTSMEHLFLFFYDCTKSEISFKKETEKTSLQIGILAGLSMTTLKFKSADFAYLVNADYNRSTNFSGGLYFDVVLPRNHGKWSINNELVLASYKVNGRYNDYENENKYVISSTTFSYSYLVVNNMLRYKYPVRNFFIFLNGGISNGFAVSEKNYRKQESKFYDILKVYEDKALNDTRKHEIGYIIGLGTSYKKISFEVRYEKANGMSEYGNLNSSTTRYNVMFGYGF